MVKERKNMANNPVKITETILRDAHQSLCATRMRIEQMVPQLEALDARPEQTPAIF